MTFVVGLTGGIGSGKSTVADLFAAHGAGVVDTDIIAHALTVAGGEAIPALCAEFGADVIGTDGSLDRTAMRRLAFSDQSAKSRLESILHPLIRERSELLCGERADAPYVLLVVPLLVESAAYRARMNRILVVDCDESLQVRRVMARSGLVEHDVRAIIAAQASRAQRLAIADDVIVNETDQPALEAQVQHLHARYVDLASAGLNPHQVNANS